MKKMTAFLLIAVMIFSLTACGDREEKSPRGKKRNGASPKATATVTPSPTATPEPTPSPTATPEPTPSPTATPELTLTPELTATPELTLTPELTATPELTPTPAPISEARVWKGPMYAIGKVTDEFGLSSKHYIGDGDSFIGSVDMIYITEAGFEKLALSLHEANADAYSYVNEGRRTAMEQQPLEDENYSDPWFTTTAVKMIRNDSAVFSYIRTNDSYMGGTSEYRYEEGYSFDTVNGKAINITSYVTDIVKLNEIVVTCIEGMSSVKDDLWEDWDYLVSNQLSMNTARWVATDYGLDVWFTSGTLAPYVCGDIRISVSVMDYPDLFTEKYIGAYGELMPKDREQNSIASQNNFELFDGMIGPLVDGIGSMTWEECKEHLVASGIPEWEGKDFEEATQCEVQPYLEFTDWVNGDHVYLSFWQSDDKDFYSEQTLTSITVDRKNLDTRLIIRDRNHELDHPVFELVDWFYGKNPVNVRFDSFLPIAETYFSMYEYLDKFPER